MRHAVSDLKLDRLTVIHAGEHEFPLADRIDAASFRQMLQCITPLA
jgi:hypothetical protein